MTDYKQLCAELLRAMDEIEECEAVDWSLVKTRPLKMANQSMAEARAALAESENHIGYPSYEQIQRFMFEVGFDIQDPDLEPAFPRAEYMKLAARIVDWTLTQ